MKILGRINDLLNFDDAGKLLLRITVCGLILFHGIKKITDNFVSIKALLAANGIPEILAYLTPIGEVVAPILIILGILVRPSAMIVTFTMIVAMSVRLGDIFMIDKVGAWAVENTAFFLLGSIAIVLLGGGKYVIGRNDYR